MENSNFKNLLNERNLKATKQRLELLQSMQDYSSAMPYSAIQKSMKSIDRVTLYRSLETLSEQGIIHQAFRDNNDVYYAICGEQCDAHEHHHQHIHFRCSNCEEVTCKELKKEIRISIPQYEIHKVSINVEGICNTCR